MAKKLDIDLVPAGGLLLSAVFCILACGVTNQKMEMKRYHMYLCNNAIITCYLRNTLNPELVGADDATAVGFLGMATVPTFP